MGRRTRLKRAASPPVSMSQLDVRALLDDGVRQFLQEPKPVPRRRLQLWVKPNKTEDDVDEMNLMDEHNDWIIKTNSMTLEELFSERPLPQPMPMNFDLNLTNELEKKKEEEETMKRKKWKEIDVPLKKRDEHQTLPKYVRPSLLLQYNEALEDLAALEGRGTSARVEAKLAAGHAEDLRVQEEHRRKLETAYQQTKAALEKKKGKHHTKNTKKLDGRRDEIQSWLMEDLEERIRSIETEIQNLDFYSIGGQGAKKFLRSGRPAVASCPPDYFPEPEDDQTPKKRKMPPNMQPISYLLSEAGIERDLRRLGQLSLLHGRAVSTFKATVDNQKLIYEGKSYPRGQPLFIQTEAFAWFPVIILAMNDGWVTFRSSIPGDTRTVTATIEDLEAGRVLVSKLPRATGDSPEKAAAAVLAGVAGGPCTSTYTPKLPARQEPVATDSFTA